MKKEEKILEEARERYEKGSSWWKDAFNAYEDDVSFLYGDQWPESVRKERELENRPCLTINRLPAFVAQVVSDMRQNSPTVQIHPIDDDSDPDTADVLEGLVRQIEYQSNADQAYDTAGETSVAGGLGAFRVVTEYSDDSSFDQDIQVKREVDPTKIIWDPAAKEYDKSDANWCFVEEYLTEDEFEDAYPDAERSDWESDHRYDGWLTDNGVRVVEYWCKKPDVKLLAMLETGETVDINGIPVFKQDGEQYINTEMGPIRVLRTREAESAKVVRYVLSGDAILEGPDEWAGKYIPIVPVMGPEYMVEGKPRYRSVIRYSKDSQRQYNYWQTTITEKVALAPKAPFIGTPKMFKGFERIWKKANTENRSFLPFNPDPTMPGGMPQRQQPAYVQQGEMAQAAQAIDDMKATIGMFDASLGNQSNETSGRAILARQSEGDSATFAWIDNQARSIRQLGRILVDLIPKIYDTERVVRIRGKDGAEDFAPINHQVYDPVADEVRIINDLSRGKYDVAVSVGPSYKTQRLEAANSLMQFVQAVPQAGQVAMDLIAKNMDWPGAEQLAERLKRVLPPGVLSPEEMQEAGIQPPQPDPMMQMEMQDKQLGVQNKQLDMQNKQMNMAKDQLDMRGKELDNAEKQLELAAQTGQLQQLVENMVAATLRQMSSGPPQQNQMM